MISWILFAVFITWILIKRFGEGGNIEGEPLGMPRGTVRALMTVMLVAFPLGYIIRGVAIPGLIINIIFVVVAFYFEARRSEHEKLKQIVDEIKASDLVVTDVRKPKKPLYLPKYSVRFLLVAILVITQILIIVQNVSFEITNTLADVLIIIILFIIGASFRSVLKAREKKKFKHKIANMDASLSDVQIIEKLMLEEPSWWKKTGKNVLSLIVLIIVIIALLCYTFDWDFSLFSTPYYSLTVVGLFLLLVNAYYGFRD
jgi:H+/gluconate symporter-like permease